MRYLMKKKLTGTIAAAAVIAYTFTSSVLTVHAEVDYNAEAEARKGLAVQSNDYENWPDGPAIGAEAAILMEANTGAVLYAKNIDERLYPASITKILTALIASEKSKMDEIVEFSEEAVHSINWREDSNMGAKVGDKMTMEQALYGVMVGSANEAAYAVAEHIAGNVEDFSKLMNARAKELGCRNSNFITPNGLHDTNHYTSVYDLALISRAYFSNELLCKMSGTFEYQVPKTAYQQNDAMVVHSKNKLLPGKAYAYENLLGSKTGYTTEARQTLISCARKNGMTLICVVMKEESPYQYEDTVSLFDYGFGNFNIFNISSNEKEYSIDHSDFFDANKDVFGNSEPVLSINQDDYIVLPNTSVFTDAASELSFDAGSDKTIATINYTYHGVPVGSASVDIAAGQPDSFQFENTPGTDSPPKETKPENTVFVNVKNVIIWILAIAGIFILIIVIRAVFDNYNFSRRGRSRRRKKPLQRKRGSRIRDLFTRYYD